MGGVCASAECECEWSLDQELEAAKKAYSEFAKTDPLYTRILSALLPKIKENPGVLQSDLYKIFPELSKEDISYALYFAAENGNIKRTKKGRTYTLMVTS